MALERRQVVIGAGGLLVGGAAVGVLSRGIDSVRAGEIGEFSIGDVETTMSGEPETVELVVDGELQWDNHEWIDRIEAGLYLEYDGVEEAFGQYVVFDPDEIGSESFSLSRDMLTHSALDGSEFDVEPEDTRELHFDARLDVIALDSDGNEQQLTSREDSFVIEVTGEGISLSVVASGEVEIEG